MDHKTIRSLNGTIHYWISKCEKSDSKNIVFTHGVTANHMMFEKQVAYFSPHHTVIVWDVPLHGESRQYKNFSFQNTAKELKSILAAEHIDKVVLIGMSMGGYPSQEFAAQYPDMVLGFIALDTTPYGLDYYSRSDKWWLRRVERIAGLIPDTILRKAMSKSVSRTPYARRLMMKMLQPLSKAEICEQMGVAYAGFLKENRDVRFDFPVLILLGEYDTTGKIKRYCHAWSEKEGYPLHIIKNAAHFSNADNPVQVNEEIDCFLRQLPK